MRDKRYYPLTEKETSEAITELKNLTTAIIGRMYYTSPSERRHNQKQKKKKTKQKNKSNE